MQQPKEPVFEERRRQPRFEVNYQATATYGRNAMKATIINISEIGIGIKLPVKLNVGEDLDVIIHCPCKENEIIDIKIKTIVVWLENECREGMFRTGIEIIDASEKNLSILRKHIQSLDQEQLS